MVWHRVSRILAHDRIVDSVRRIVVYAHCNLTMHWNCLQQLTFQSDVQRKRFHVSLFVGHIVCTQCRKCGLFLQTEWRGLCVCSSRSWALQNGWNDRDAVWEWMLTWMGDGPKEPRSRLKVEISHGQGQCWGLSGPLKSIVSQFCGALFY